MIAARHHPGRRRRPPTTITATATDTATATASAAKKGQERCRTGTTGGRHQRSSPHDQVEAVVGRQLHRVVWGSWERAAQGETTTSATGATQKRPGVPGAEGEGKATGTQRRRGGTTVVTAAATVTATTHSQHSRRVHPGPPDEEEDAAPAAPAAAERRRQRAWEEHAGGGEHSEE